MKTELTKNQKKQYKRETKIDGKLALVVLRLRHDDKYGNGHNTFSITADIYEQGFDSYEPYLLLSNGRIARMSMCGMCHDTVEKVFPEFKHVLKWHGTTTDGPLHYIKNTMYWAKNGNLENARSCAIWPDAELEDFSKETLEERLPKLMESFHKDITDLGFKY